MLSGRTGGRCIGLRTAPALLEVCMLCPREGCGILIIGLGVMLCVEFCNWKFIGDAAILDIPD